jgi:hypothetical protein
LAVKTNATINGTAKVNNHPGLPDHRRRRRPRTCIVIVSSVSFHPEAVTLPGSLPRVIREHSKSSDFRLNLRSHDALCAQEVLPVRHSGEVHSGYNPHIVAEAQVCAPLGEFR